MVSSSKKAWELDLLRSFLKVETVQPLAKLLVGEPSKDERPDFIFTGKPRVGVELKAWLNERQIKEAKKWESIEKTFRALLSPQPARPCNISFVSLHPRKRAPKDKAQAKALKLALLQAIQDAVWPPHADKLAIDSFTGILAKHFTHLTLFPQSVSRKKRKEWLTFPPQGGFFNMREMLTPLSDLMTSTLRKYARTKREKCLDRLVLLIHYDWRSWKYNSPIETPNWGFDQFADEATTLVGKVFRCKNEPFPWDEIWLYDDVRRRARRVFPTPTARRGATRPGPRRQVKG